MLIAIVSLYVTFGSVDIVAITTAMSGATVGYAVFILMMFSLAFGIKNALLPLHPWLPSAYAESPTPFTAVLGGMLTRLGVYGFLLVMYVMIGMPLVHRMSYGLVNYQIILAWLGGITILFGVFVAVFKDDAKQILAWSSIGHGGYMILGLAIFSTLGLAGGIFHVLNYAMCVSLLFLAVGAVEYRTGTRDLTKLGGLHKRMPVTFVSAMIAVFGMIGVPLTSGFVSKWLIYKGLILGGHPFLTFTALIGTWGTILYGYKLIHNTFLGRLPRKYAQVEEVPWTMQAPMIALSSLIVLFGILPGIPLKAVALIETSFGVKPIVTGLVGMPQGVGEMNLLNILGGIIAATLIMYALFSLTARPHKAGSQDTYTAGAPTPSENYNYTSRFYDPAENVMRPYLHDWIGSFYGWVGRQSTAFFESARKIYSGNINTYALWIVILLGVFVTMNLLGWRP
jgi:NADH-quinone oxidoreductase subunit M